MDLRLDSILAAMRRWTAKRLVDRQYYLSCNPDVAQAAVDPVTHYAENWYKYPLRAPNQGAAAAIFALSPLAVLILSALGRDRQDWIDCLRKRIIDLSCTDRKVEHDFALRVARVVGERLQRDVTRLSALHGQGFGVTMPVRSIVDTEADDIQRHHVQAEGPYDFVEPQDIDEPRNPLTRTVQRPPLWCATIPDAQVFGFFQVAAGGSLITYEPAAKPSYRFVARQAEFVITCFPGHDKVLARIPTQPDAHVPEAVLLGGRCGNNYYHFLIEYLTRGMIIEQSPHLAGLPLIVSEELYRQEYDALELALPGRDLIRRRHGTRLDVGTLHVPAIMTDLPDSAELPFWKLGAVNNESLRWLRHRILQNIGGPIPPMDPTRRIYLSRSGSRSITNHDAVEREFRDRGFMIVDPSTLTFADQVRLFASASVIAGPMGAALSNVIFAPEGSRVIVLSSPFLVRFPIFANLAAFAGCQYTAIAGQHPRFRPGSQDERAPLNLSHTDFSIAISKLRRGLAALA